MLRRGLIFLGSDDAEGAPAFEGQPLSVGCRLELVRKRSPWGKKSDLVRVIVGTDPLRADLLLTGAGLMPEHARFYFHPEKSDTTDFRPLHPGCVRVNGRVPETLEWVRLLGGEELALGPLRFRYEELEP